MSKEWLKEVKDKWDYAYESGKYGSYLSAEDIESLIEQAELVQELKEKLNIKQIHLNSANAQIYFLTEQNKRLREELEFYADRKNHRWSCKYSTSYVRESEVMKDWGHRARKALEGEE